MWSSIKLARRWRLVTVAVVLVVTVLAIGCGGGTSSTTSPSPTVAAEQPVFRMGVIGTSIDSLNPYNAFTGVDFAAFMQMYPSLIQFSADLKAQPDLAQSWSTSTDGKTWTFKLRSDAVWTDGKPITASDAAFTINTAVKFQAGAAAGLAPFLLGVKDASATDSTTLVVNLDHPVAGMLANIFMLPIVPEHVWGPLAGGDGSKLKTLTNDPGKETVVVAGPFTVQKYDAKGTTLFVPVKTYYGKKPLIKGFGFQLFTNPDAAVQALKAGQVDITYSVPAAVTASLKGDAKLQVQGFTKTPMMFAVNNSPDFAKHPELRDVKVRQAIDIAIDRQQIVDTVYQGFATPGGSVLYPEFAPTFMSAPLSVPARDVTQANAILDGLGYKKSSDGIRVANGHPMKYTVLLYSALAGDMQRIFGVLKQNLADVGIALESKMTDNPLGLFIGKNGKYQDYDAWLAPFVGSPDPDSGLNIFTTSLRGAVSPTGVSDAAFDKLFAQESQETDPVARKAIIDQMVAMMQQNHMEIPLVYWQSIAAWDKRWQNVPDLASIFYFFSYTNKTEFTQLGVQQ